MPNMENMDRAEVKTTICPASSPSAPLCCAMGKLDTAVGVPNSTASTARSIPRKPMRTAMVRQMPGTRTNRPRVHQKRGAAQFFMEEKEKLPPKTSRASGVVIFEMSVMAELRIPGSRIRKTRARIPKIEAMIKGLLRIPHKMLKKLIFPF